MVVVPGRVLDSGENSDNIFNKHWIAIHEVVSKRFILYISTEKKTNFPADSTVWNSDAVWRTISRNELSVEIHSLLWNKRWVTVEQIVWHVRINSCLLTTKLSPHTAVLTSSTQNRRRIISKQYLIWETYHGQIKLDYVTHSSRQNQDNQDW